MMITKVVIPTLAAVLMPLLYASCGVCAGSGARVDFINISVVDSAGNDLLNPDHPNAYRAEGIRILIGATRNTFKSHHSYQDVPFALSDTVSGDRKRYEIQIALNNCIADECRLVDLAMMIWDNDGQRTDIGDINVDYEFDGCKGPMFKRLTYDGKPVEPVFQIVKEGRQQNASPAAAGG